MSTIREFHFNRDHFVKIKDMIYEHAGISLSDAKEQLVYGRLARRLRALKIKSFEEYTGLLTDDSEEYGNFINALTTNLTAFFRENHHFETLSREVIPELLRQRSATRKLRIWSAGCSTGEEPYSLAMTLLESMPDIGSWDVRILATDVDTNVIHKAKTGIYGEERVADLSSKRLSRWFEKGIGANRGSVRVVPEVQRLITFKPLNLMHAWPMKGPFDIIFCRNVIIYFNKDTQRVLIDRYADILADNGYLFLGHSEALHDVSTRFGLLGKSSYRKSA